MNKIVHVFRLYRLSLISTIAVNTDADADADASSSPAMNDAEPATTHLLRMCPLAL